MIWSRPPRFRYCMPLYSNIRTPVSEPAQVDMASYARYDEYASHDNLPPLEPPLIISLDGPPLQSEPDSSELSTEVLCEPPPPPQPQPQPLSEPAMSAVPEQVAEIMLPAAQPMTPIVEWPPEEQRHILSIRVVGLSPRPSLGQTAAPGAVGVWIRAWALRHFSSTRG